MSTNANGQVYGQQDVSTDDNEYNTLAFVFQMLLSKVQTAALVKVVECTNSGGVSPVGTVTVQPLVNQMSGNRKATPHGQLYGCVYTRIVGGASAVILDPDVGDIGLMVFCSRDISAVVAAADAANPGSFRWFDWADGVYVAGVPLGVTPTQYVRFRSAGAGVDIVSPTEVTITAPNVTINASTLLSVNSPDSEYSGNIAAQGQVAAGSGGSAVHLTTHVHPDPQGGSTSPPTPGS